MSYTGYPKALEQYLEYNKKIFELKDESGNDIDMSYILGTSLGDGDSGGDSNTKNLVRYIRIENRTGNAEYLQLRELKAFNSNFFNVAQFGTASQSSRLDVDRRGPEFGNDNDITIDSEFLAITSNGDDEWWEVDLLQNYDIGYVEVYNRADGFSDRLNQYKMVLLNEDRAELFSYDFENGEDLYQITIPELQAPAAQEPYNVALDANGSVATQSSRYGVNDDNYAFYANNGVTIGNFGIASHTNFGLGEWLRIDFEGIKQVERVVLYTLDESWYVGRWQQLKVELLDVSDNVLNSVFTADYTEVNYQVEIPFFSTINVKAIKITTISDDVPVQLKEVEVYGIDM